MNLTTHKKTRRHPEKGDLFVLQPRGKPFYFGRVIATDANPLGVAHGILIYIYRAPCKHKADFPHTQPPALLVPPLITNALPWSRGYFEHVSNIPLKQQELLGCHAFWDCVRNVFRDEYGNILKHPAGECGVWGLHSYMTIDDEISKALGLPVSED